MYSAYEGFSICIVYCPSARQKCARFQRFALVWFCLFPLPPDAWEGLRFVIVALPRLYSYFLVFLLLLLVTRHGCTISNQLGKLETSYGYPNRKEGNGQESIQLPNTFRQRHQRERRTHLKQRHHNQNTSGRKPKG